MEAVFLIEASFKCSRTVRPLGMCPGREHAREVVSSEHRAHASIVLQLSNSSVLTKLGF